MEVQSYLVEETKELLVDVEKLDEWKKAVDELGLEGQQKLVSKEDKTPIPFEFAHEGLMRVVSSLCPRQIKVKEFDKSAIPLQVLSLIALAEREAYFEEIQIHYNDTDCPFVIGRTEDGDRYLIARWGDVADSLEKLETKAKKIWMESRKAYLKKGQAELEVLTSSLEADCIKHFSGNYITDYISLSR